MPLFAAPQIERTDRPDGSILLSSADPLQPYARSLGDLLLDGATRHPDRPLITRCTTGEALSWGHALKGANALAQAMLDAGLGPDRPAMVLSGNSISHALITCAAYRCGVPVVPVSTAYSLASGDHARVRAIADLVRPGWVFAEDEKQFDAALSAVESCGATAVVAADAVSGSNRREFADLLRTVPTEAVDHAAGAVSGDTVAKYLFTSGSTGTPKGVANTHRMLCANQQQMRQVWPFLATEPPVLVDWLPWSHTFGGNHNFNMILANGGTLHIDDGKPMPGLFDRTLAALDDHAPTAYFNVPMGFQMLAPRLESDGAFATRFFSRVRLLFYAAASLPAELHQRLTILAERHADRPVPLISSWGTTETGPAVTSAHYEGSPSGCIGVPIPGDTLKLVPTAEKLEIRVKGPNITPGYVGAPEATAAAFDDEGFYVTGDAVRFVDPDDMNTGLLFDGRIAEDFKLLSGTWVSVGNLRTALVSAAGGLLTDAVLCGHDSNYVAALAWPAAAAVRELAGEEDLAAACGSVVVRDAVAGALATLNAGQGSAARVERVLVLLEPPALDAGEITDKGYVNQRVALDRRAESVRRLYLDPVDPDVITPAG